MLVAIHWFLETCRTALQSSPPRKTNTHTDVEAHKLLPATVIIYHPGRCGGLHTSCLEHISQQEKLDGVESILRKQKQLRRLIQIFKWQYGLRRERRL